MKTKLPLAILLSFAQIAVAQNLSHMEVRRGTFGAYDYSQQRIIFAADSRMTKRIGPPTDDGCKLTALGKRIMFFSDGLTAAEMRVGPYDLSWTSWDEAHHAYQRTAPTADQNLLSSTANAWAAAVIKHIQQMYAFDRNVVIADGRNGILTTALFGESRQDRVALYSMEIRIDPSSIVPIYAEPLTESLIGTNALGHNDIEKEFFPPSTPRAQREVNLWLSGSRNLSQEDFDISEVRQAVKWTIAYDTSGTVGGPIDSAELWRGKDLHWISKKCPSE